MLLLGLTLTVTACATPFDNVFLPGNDSLLIGLPDPANPNNIILADPIIRTPSQQQAAITTFNAFPAGTLNSAAGVIIILNPGNHVVAAKMAALNLAVGNLGALDNWSSSLFHGIMGITRTDTIGFGGSNFIDSFGIPGAPVQFYVQNYQQTGVNANQFITPQGLNARYRLGFVTEPAQPFVAPDSGSTLLLLVASVLAVAAVFKLWQPAFTV